MRSRTSWSVAAGFAGGMVAGLLLWSAQTSRSRRDLFSRVRCRRLAALGYVRGQRSISSVNLLRDYVQWERHAPLRRRGEAILRRMEESLE